MDVNNTQNTEPQAEPAAQEPQQTGERMFTQAEVDEIIGKRLAKERAKHEQEVTRDDRWVVHVKAITMQTDPVIHMLHPGREVWIGQGLSVESNLFQTISKQVPGLKKVYMTPGGSHYHVILQIDPPNNGMAKNAILAAFAAFPDLQMVTAVNSDIDIYDPEQVERAMVTRCDPAKDIIIIPGAFGHELNPVVKDNLAAKMGFDCTYPVPKPESYTLVSFQDVDISKYDID